MSLGHPRPAYSRRQRVLCLVVTLAFVGFGFLAWNLLQAHNLLRNPFRKEQPKHWYHDHKRQAWRTGFTHAPKFNTTGGATPPKPIPVIGFGLNTDPNMYLLRLFHSLDFDYDNLVIVIGAIDDIVQAELDHIKRHTPKASILTNGGRWLGVSDTWNRIIKFDQYAPWVFIISMDVEFYPGSLYNLARHVWDDLAPRGPGLDQAVIDYSNPDMTGRSYCGFVVTRGYVKKVGLFDENLWPAYYEDSDMEVRHWKYNKANPKTPLKLKIYSDVVAFHGMPKGSGVDSRGVVAVYLAQQKDPKDMKDNEIRPQALMEVSWRFLQPYIRDKWGCDLNSGPHWASGCLYDHPWNTTRNKISYWKFNTTRRKEINDLLYSRQPST